MTEIPENFRMAVKFGYVFQPSVTDAIKIIDDYFKGLDLSALTIRLEVLLKQHAEEPIAREIEVSIPPPLMRFEYKSENYLDENDGLYLSRTFKYADDDLIVDHEMQQLPYSARNQSLGKKVMAAFLEQYEKMGVKRIDLYAALSDGGAVWAKFGFKAIRKTEMERILQNAEQNLQHKPKILTIVINTFNDYYGKEPDGTAFPIANWANIPDMAQIMKMPGCHWHGCIDLTNKKDLRNFKIYVGQGNH